MAGEALEEEAGKLVYQIPSEMLTGRPEIVEVRIGVPEAANLTIGLVGSGKVVVRDLPIVETMTVQLVSHRDVFRIEPKSQATQLVRRTMVHTAAFAHQDYGRWLWSVKPQRSGHHELIVKVSANLHDSRGIASSAALPERFFTVHVRVDYVRFGIKLARGAAYGLTGALLTSLIGVFTQDMWWPVIRAWFGI